MSDKFKPDAQGVCELHHGTHTVRPDCSGWKAMYFDFPNPTPEHEHEYAHLILGMKRALNACENCDGDLDFAIFIIKKDIAELEAQNG